MKAVEIALADLRGDVDVLQGDVERILASRKSERARAMAGLRWDKAHAEVPAPPAGNGIGADPVSQRIRAARDARRASLADLAARPPKVDEEEE